MNPVKGVFFMTVKLLGALFFVIMQSGLLFVQAGLLRDVESHRMWADLEYPVPCRKRRNQL